jgi:membrane-associated phospholipid phosphatase
MTNALIGLLAAWPLMGPTTTPLSAGAPVLEPAAAPQLRTVGPLELAPARGGQRTLSQFFPGAARNTVRMWTGDNARPFLIGAGAAGLGSLFDTRARRYFEQNPMHDLGTIGGHSGNVGLVVGSSLAMLGLSQSVGGERFRAAAYDTTQAVLVNTFYTFGLKSTTHRWRPDGSNQLSFPSGHTSNAFAIATVWSRQYGARAAVPGYFLAGLVGVSRMASQKHHLSDVVAGATLGYLVGSTVSRGNGGRVEPRREPRFSLGVDSGPSGDGVGLSLSLNLFRR